MSDSQDGLRYCRTFHTALHRLQTRLEGHGDTFDREYNELGIAGCGCSALPEDVAAFDAEVQRIRAQILRLQSRLAESEKVEVHAFKVDVGDEREKMLAETRIQKLEDELAASRADNERLRQRAEAAESIVARSQRSHRTKPEEALNRATIRSVAEDDGFVHAADVLRLLQDVEAAETELAAANARLEAEEMTITEILMAASVALHWAVHDKTAASAKRAVLALCQMHENSVAATFAAAIAERNRVDADKATQHAMNAKLADAVARAEAAEAEAAAHNAAATQYEKDIRDRDFEISNLAAACMRSKKYAAEWRETAESIVSRYDDYIAECVQLRQERDALQEIIPVSYESAAMYACIDYCRDHGDPALIDSVHVAARVTNRIVRLAKSAQTLCPCDRCDGSGWDWQYDPEMGRTETRTRCPSCEGTGRKAGS